jgi:predicted Zn-dependent peptidase
MFVAPGPGAPDYPAARVANFALRERLFEEVRTKRNLSYAPNAPYDVNADASFAGLYVTAVDPNTTIPVMTRELTRLKEQPMGEEELAGTKSEYRTRFLMQEETTDGQATSLGRGLLLAGDWRYFGKLLDAAAKVTAADVQAYARKYAKDLQFVLLGDPAKLDPKLVAY